MHLVEKLFILSENFWFKFIPDEDCPNTDPEGIILDPTPDQAKSFGSDTVTKELNSFLIGHVERSKIHPLLSEEEVCLQSWEVPHQSEVLQVRFLWREVCYSQVKNGKKILKIESVAITDSSFGSQNLVYFYILCCGSRSAINRIMLITWIRIRIHIEKSKFIRRIRIHTIFLDIDQKWKEYEHVLAR